MTPIRYWQTLTHLGPGWVLFRIQWAVQKRLGWLERKSPKLRWTEVSTPKNTTRLRSWFDVREVGPKAVAEADEILEGRFRLFSTTARTIGEFPSWNRDPISGVELDSHEHWSRTSDAGSCDIKCVWELSRLGWAFPLARAYACTGKEVYAERFWRLFEDWMEHNPPNTGPNWMCGQEVTFRLMAATFAVEVLGEAGCSTSDRQEMFRKLVLATGRRIAAHLDYALSQANNHGISECIGLITAASLIANGPETAQWRKRGVQELRRQLAELVYPDGGFAQNSAIYHRLLLHDLLWVIAVERAAGNTDQEWLVEAARRTLKYAAELTNPATGRVPLYGANDGANVLPLSDAEYLDFRPVVQAGAALLHGECWLSAGPWDEAAAWLAGGKNKNAELGKAAIEPEIRSSAGHAHFADSGLLLLKSGRSRLAYRCPTRFRHRPSQADLLHVDVEWDDQPIARDAGTFSYNTKGVFRDSLSEAAVHNTVTFSNDEPLRKVSRFLYLPWPKGSMDASVPNRFTATHDGWQRRGARHVRTVGEGRDGGFVVDDLVSCARPERVRLHWLLADLPYELECEKSRLVLRTNAGNYHVEWMAPARAVVSLVRADPSSNRGWWAPHYGEAAPALSLAIEFELAGSAELQTTFRPEIE